jgi:signal transduction histidine kinase
MQRLSLRTKLLLSTLLVTVAVTCACLLIVRHSVNVQVHRQLDDDLRNSVATFQHFQRQREANLSRGARLLVSLPSLKALMTTRDPVTIQDASGDFFRVSGADLLALADRSGKVVALHASGSRLSKESAQSFFTRSLSSTESEWWFDGQRLFQVVAEPIYFGAPARNSLLGFLAVGFEINDAVAVDIGRISGSEVAFHVENAVAASTLSSAQQSELSKRIPLRHGAIEDVVLGGERYLGSSVQVAPASAAKVGLSVLKSYDRATAFLASLNRVLAGLGAFTVLTGFLLVLLISYTFTRPLEELVAGVRALERGDFRYPLVVWSGDEVGEVTRAFAKMRQSLQEAQHQLLISERLATIGRMASSISHDLRHPLTAIMANSEFLSESELTAEDREHLYAEIRAAVGQMTDLVDSLLEFSRGRESLHVVDAKLDQAIVAAVHAIQARPEFQRVRITTSFTGENECSFDVNKMERAFYNLLLNACEAVAANSGEVTVSVCSDARGVEVSVADNGPGIPESVRDKLFQPFITAGKESGIGLGLAIVRKIIADHGGEVRLEATSSVGTVFKVWLPRINSAFSSSGQQLGTERWRTQLA